MSISISISISIGMSIIMMGGGPEKGHEIGVFSYVIYCRIPFFVLRRIHLGDHLSSDLKPHKNSDLTRNPKWFPKSFLH